MMKTMEMIEIEVDAGFLRASRAAAIPLEFS